MHGSANTFYPCILSFLAIRTCSFDQESVTQASRLYLVGEYARTCTQIKIGSHVGSYSVRKQFMTAFVKAGHFIPLHCLFSKVIGVLDICVTLVF